MRTAGFFEDDLFLPEVVGGGDCADADAGVGELLTEAELEADVALYYEEDRLRLVSLPVDDVLEVEVSDLEVVYQAQQLLPHQPQHWEFVDHLQLLLEKQAVRIQNLIILDVLEGHQH